MSALDLTEKPETTKPCGQQCGDPDFEELDEEMRPNQSEYKCICILTLMPGIL